MNKLLLCTFLGLSLLLGGCSKQQKSEAPKPQTENGTPGTASTPSTQNTPSSTQSKVQESTQNKTSSEQKTFTLDELKKYNGENGSSAYVAVDGIVYDVTNAKKWKNGKHEGYSAGKDLSKAINSSPHGKSVLKDLPVVGKLQ